ncbi:MAG: phenylalanine--tRNA ligase subunit beta [Acutalibacteraceae bacterium]|jgi:phenylalanyl-tRNA synthetase beta chain
MKLSKKWLKDYYDYSVSDKEFADNMTMTGSKVEGIEIEGAMLSNIVVGQVITVEPHSNSDHLFVCSVNVGGNKNIQIVTGAQNVCAGDFVPVALDNSTIHGGKTIKKGEIRGVESNGMLCSLAELGLTVMDFPYSISDGIFILGEDCVKTPGMDIRESIGLDDTVFEFEITSNRPDCLSVIGLAREASASFGDLLQIDEPVTPSGKGNINNLLEVSISDSGKCYRYIGAVVENVKVEPSPRWLRERLRASGVRPINNIVDITNYVMLEYGQPMHAFDINLVENRKIIVRTAAQGEKIVTLDGIERSLTPDMLVIADSNKPIAIAGVMGGEFSGILENTTTVVFESASFNGANVRSTAKKLGMRTESSSRFEKQLDPNACIKAMNRALELVKVLGAGEIITGLADCYPLPKTCTEIPFNTDWINEFIGINLSYSQQENYLNLLGFSVENGNVIVPTFRQDIEHLADLSEEIARLYGYENIPNRELTGIADGRLTQMQSFEVLVSDTLLSCGYTEVQTYSFYSPKCLDKILLPEDSELRNYVKILNPLGEDTGIMRTTALPSMLEVLAYNFKHKNTAAKLFEIATEYHPVSEEELPDENPKLIIGAYGHENGYLMLKGCIEELFDVLGIINFSFSADNSNISYHPSRCALISVDGDNVGLIGEINPLVSDNYEVNTRFYVAELDMELLFKAKNLLKLYTPMPKFPPVDRDLSLLCDKNTPVQKLKELISEAVGELMESIELFDIYEGKQIPADKKSVAFSLRLRSAQKTLTDEEADALMNNAIKTLSSHGITIRT